LASRPLRAAFEAGVGRVNARHPWSHNEHFHGWIVANLPDPCRTALDVGCGRGDLLAALVPHVGTVIGNDADATMREQAARRCAGLSNVSIIGGAWVDREGPFDVVTMIAVLHHLDVRQALRAVRRLLAPGGRFLAVGLAVPRSFQDHVWEAASVVTNPVIGYVKHPWPPRAGSQQPSFPVRDPTMSYDELRATVGAVMPGAIFRRRIAFRHTIAWTKP
jgi:SAM-dependent methyltransferase